MCSASWMVGSEVATICTSRIAMNMPTHIMAKPVHTGAATVSGWACNGVSSRRARTRCQTEFVFRQEPGSVEGDAIKTPERSRLQGRPSRLAITKALPAWRRAHCSRYFRGEKCGVRKHAFCAELAGSQNFINAARRASKLLSCKESYHAGKSGSFRPRNRLGKLLLVLEACSHAIEPIACGLRSKACRS